MTKDIALSTAKTFLNKNGWTYDSLTLIKENAKNFVFIINNKELLKGDFGGPFLVSVNYDGSCEITE